MSKLADLRDCQPIRPDQHARHAEICCRAQVAPFERVAADV
ncbi:MAG TPA: hypothetical protein VHW09_33030 [Bryobacteraceae bacterium]|jgi:hypothetical protein|nr:hypothetical protein [Bryobacteraceae bacterium]